MREIGWDVCFPWLLYKRESSCWATALEAPSTGQFSLVPSEPCFAGFVAGKWQTRSPSETLSDELYALSPGTSWEMKCKMELWTRLISGVRATSTPRLTLAALLKSTLQKTALKTEEGILGAGKLAGLQWLQCHLLASAEGGLAVKILLIPETQKMQTLPICLLRYEGREGMWLFSLLSESACLLCFTFLVP